MTKSERTTDAGEEKPTSTEAPPTIADPWAAVGVGSTVLATIGRDDGWWEAVVLAVNPQDDTFQDQPVVVAEVLSNRTRRVDTTEKKESYLTISTLGVYLLVEQDFAAVTVHRRTEQGFAQEIYRGIDCSIPLAEIGTELPLADIYDGVEFTPEPDDQDD